MAKGILSTTVPDHSFKRKKTKKSKKSKKRARVSEVERLNAIVSSLIQNNLAMAIALNQFGNSRQIQDDAMCVTHTFVATAALEEGGKNP